MKKGFYLALIICFYTKSFAQTSKPPIDSTAIANWADLLWSEPVISDDGKYFMYSINNRPPGSSTLVVQQTEGTWKKEFIGTERGFFSGDSKQAIFKKNDSLYILPLGKEKPMIIASVSGYKKPSSGAGQWLAYQSNGTDKELVLHNIFTGYKHQYQNVSDYLFDNNGKVLLLKRKITTDSTTLETVAWINLESTQTYTVWSSTDNKVSANRFQFDDAGQQLAFIVEEQNNSTTTTNSVWYYKEAMPKAIVKVTDQSQGIDAGMIVSNSPPSFSKNSKFIFFKIRLKPEQPLRPDPNGIQLDIWNYKDLILQSSQIRNVKSGASNFEPKKEFLAFASLTENEVHRIERENESIVAGLKNEIDFLVVSNQTYRGDKSWENKLISYFLISLKSASRTLLKTGRCSNFSFSIKGTHLVYFDELIKHYFSFDLYSKVSLNISKNISVSLIDEERTERTRFNTIPVGLVGWLNDSNLIVYDNYDIWKINASATKTPVNLTKGIGGLYKIKFQVINEVDIDNHKIDNRNNYLLLTAFNTYNKHNGFYKVMPSSPNLEKLIIGPYNYYTTAKQTAAVSLLNMKPLKARKVNVWIVKRQTSSESPNFFLTKDFKKFERLTNIEPNKAYNWYTTELLHWKLQNDKLCQGVLYKPEDFDSSKKYPVIIHYYEKKSANMYQYLQPSLTDGPLNIPLFVSQGYLVFTPDIHYTVGNTAESIFHSVLGGVERFVKFSFIDSAKIGIIGHSFGGYETNVLITHSNIFAAAISAAGSTNFVSQRGTLLPRGNVSSHFERDGQYRIEVTPWENIFLYKDNSPLYKIDKVRTPLLIMHNKNDEQVPWGQSVELFIGLRRLNKPVWMLQYDNGGHGIDGKEALDFSMRTFQFFNHYLKRASAAKWMTEDCKPNERETKIDLIQSSKH